MRESEWEVLLPRVGCWSSIKIRKNTKNSKKVTELVTGRIDFKCSVENRAM